VEMGFIADEEDLMRLEEALLAEMLEEALNTAGDEIRLLGATWPSFPQDIPRLTHAEAKRILKEELGYPVGQDLSEEAERLLGEYAKERWGSDWLFVTRYPRSVRPFYTYPEEDGTTRSFDLLFRGLEITSGGQRIHRYEELLESLKAKGMDPEAFHGYHRGRAPHPEAFGPPQRALRPRLPPGPAPAHALKQSAPGFPGRAPFTPCWLAPAWGSQQRVLKGAGRRKQGISPRSGP
jgi:aspartyl/asparaginyl-tRNA synthetase